MVTKSALVALSILGLTALSAEARTPTNDAAAFKTFHQYNDRTASANTSDHLNFASYPSSWPARRS
jgi:hypothetical protein